MRSALSALLAAVVAFALGFAAASLWWREERAGLMDIETVSLAIELPESVSISETSPTVPVRIANTSSALDLYVRASISGEPLWESSRMRPGQSVDAFTLSHLMGKGEYPLKLTYMLVDSELSTEGGLLIDEIRLLTPVEETITLKVVPAQ